MDFPILPLDLQIPGIDHSRLQLARARFALAVSNAERGIALPDSSNYSDCQCLTYKLVNAMESLIQEAFDCYNFEITRLDRLEEFTVAVARSAYNTIEFVLRKHLGYRRYWDWLLARKGPYVQHTIGDYVQVRLSGQASESKRAKLTRALEPGIAPTPQVPAARPKDQQPIDREALRSERRELFQNLGITIAQFAKPEIVSRRTFQRWLAGDALKKNTDTVIRSAIHELSAKRAPKATASKMAAPNSTVA